MAKRSFFFNDQTFFVFQGLLKYLPFEWSVSLRTFIYRPFFKYLGKNVKIKDGTTFKYPSEIQIGENTIIGEHCYLVGKSGLTLGKNGLIGSGSKIITSTHVFLSRQVPIKSQGLVFMPVELGEDVWLGFDVKVLPGSFIANGCIVGTGSLVNREFREPFKIIVGSPAKIDKERP